MALGYVAALRHAQLDAITTQVGTGAIIRIYSGTRPATGGTATTVLAELSVSGAFAPAASASALTVNAITQDSSANATGTASWGRVLTSGDVPKIDFDVGSPSGFDLNLNSASITAGGTVSITSFVITAGNP